LKKKYLIFTMILLLLFITGCQKINIPEGKESQIIEYAVNSVKKHDKNYIIKLPEIETETTIEETTWYSGDNNNPTNTQGETTTSNTTVNNNYTVNEVMSMPGFDINYKDYVVSNNYPEDAGDLGFNMIATKGFDLLVLKFNVTNNTGADNIFNTLDLKYSYKAIVNNSTKLNAQATALLDSLNTYNSVIKKGETKEMVLVFQIKEDISSTIARIDLSVTANNISKTAALKK